MPARNAVELQALTGLDVESAQLKGIALKTKEDGKPLFDCMDVKRYLAQGSGDDE